MLVSDCIAYERILLATPSNNNARWNDTQLTLLTDRAVKATVAAVYFPECRVTITTSTASQQEYQIPEMHAIYRVYVNGQPIQEIPGGVDTLEGRQILHTDHSAQGAIPAGSGAAPGGTIQQPQWAIQQPVAYPFINAFGNSVSPNVQSSWPGQAPRFYRRGGFLGFVPAVGAVGNIITIDGVAVPATLTTTGASVLVPDNFMEAIADFVCYRAMQSDKDPLSAQMASEFKKDYDAEIRKLRTWKRQYSLDDSQLMPMSPRSPYRFGGNRVGGYR